jgi:hypothetical protein
MSTHVVSPSSQERVNLATVVASVTKWAYLHLRHVISELVFTVRCCCRFGCVVWGVFFFLPSPPPPPPRCGMSRFFRQREEEEEEERGGSNDLIAVVSVCICVCILCVCVLVVGVIQSS